MMACVLSLQPDIIADCMEQLSIYNGDLRKMVDEVVLQLHYLPWPNKKGANKSNDEIIDIFLERVQIFHSHCLC